MEFDANKYIFLLINAKANVNAQTNNGKTPLHLACQLNEIGICRKLILSGADVFMKDNRDMYPHSIEICGQEFHEQFLEKFRTIIGKNILDLKKQFNYVITASIESGVFSEQFIYTDILNLEAPTPIDNQPHDGDMESTDDRITNFVHSPTSVDFMTSFSPYKAGPTSNNHYKLTPQQQQLQKQQQQQITQQHHQQQLQRNDQSNMKNLLGSATVENTISLNVTAPRNKRPKSNDLNSTQLIDDEDDDDNTNDRFHTQNGDATPQRKFPVVSAQSFSSQNRLQGLQCAREISPSPNTRKTMNHQNAISNNTLNSVGRSFYQQFSSRESVDESGESEENHDFLRPSPIKPYKVNNKVRAELAPRTQEPNVQLNFDDKETIQVPVSQNQELISREEQFMLQVKQKNASNLQGSPKLTPRRPMKRSRIEYQQQQQQLQQRQQQPQQQPQQPPVLLSSSGDDFHIPTQDHLSTSDPIVTFQQQQENGHHSPSWLTNGQGANKLSNGVSNLVPDGNEFTHTSPSKTRKNGRDSLSPSNRNFVNGFHLTPLNSPFKDGSFAGTEESPRKKKVLPVTVSPYK